MNMKKRILSLLLVFLLVAPIFVMAVSDTCGFWCTIFGGNVVGEAVATSRTELGSAYVNLPYIISDAVLFADSAGNIYLSKEVDDINPLVGIKYNSAANTIYPERGYKFSSNDGGDSRKGRYIVVRRDDDDTSSYLGIPSPLLRDSDSAPGTSLAGSATLSLDEASAPPAGDTASDLTFTYTGWMNRDNDNSYLLGLDRHYYEEKKVGDKITLELLPDGIPMDSLPDSRSDGTDYALPADVNIDSSVHLEGLDLSGDEAPPADTRAVPSPAEPGDNMVLAASEIYGGYTTSFEVAGVNYDGPGNLDKQIATKTDEIKAAETAKKPAAEITKLNGDLEKLKKQKAESEEQFEIFKEEKLKTAESFTTALTIEEKKAAGSAAYDNVQTKKRDVQTAQSAFEQKQKEAIEAAKNVERQQEIVKSHTTSKKLETLNQQELEALSADLQKQGVPKDVVTLSNADIAAASVPDASGTPPDAATIETAKTNALRAKIQGALTAENDKQTAAETVATKAKEVVGTKKDALTKAEFTREVTDKANGNEWQGGSGYLYVLSFIQNTPTYPALTNALLKDVEFYKDWRTTVERYFVPNYLLSSYFIAAACENDYDVGPSESLLIQTGPDTYQFVGSLQAERSPNPTTVITCDETRICPQNGQCRDNLCYKDASATEPMKGYLYKITWGVTAPSDMSFTVRRDEARDQVDFNLQMDDIWLFRDPETGASGPNVNHLGVGKSSKSLGLPSIIVEAYPPVKGQPFKEVCIRFGQNKPRDIRNNQVEDYCKEFVPSNLGTVNMNSGVDSNGNSASESSHVGQYCGFEGKC